MSATRAEGPPPDSTASAPAAVRTWVALYTRGLPTELATVRRELIDAELWDEARAAEWLGETASLGRQRWSRLLRGIPADLAWRLEQHERATGTTRRMKMRISKVHLLAIGAVIIQRRVGRRTAGLAQLQNVGGHGLHADRSRAVHRRVAVGHPTPPGGVHHRGRWHRADHCSQPGHETVRGTMTLAPLLGRVMSPGRHP